jgi:ribosomal protein L15E
MIPILSKDAIKCEHDIVKTISQSKSYNWCLVKNEIKVSFYLIMNSNWIINQKKKLWFQNVIVNFNHNHNSILLTRFLHWYKH